MTAIFALLVVPRMLRLAYPQVWIEDESYLTGALMLSHGWLPYRDFPLPHYPVLEALLASVFHVVHASIRSAEITTQIAALAGSLLVFALGRRLDGLLTGAVGALVFATSGLLFRYHLLEREVFVVVPVLAAVLLASKRRAKAPERANNSRSTQKLRNPQRQAMTNPQRTPRSLRLTSHLFTGSSAERKPIVIGVLLFVALTIKLTAIAALVAVGLQLWLQDRERGAGIAESEAVRAIGTALGLLAALTIALTAVFGNDFVVQVFLFRAVHAAFPSLAVKLTEMRLTMDASLACGAAGGALILWSRRTRAWRGPLLQLGADFVVLVLFNPTYWAHTGIELLPWLSLAAGFLVAGVVRALRRPASRAEAAGRIQSARVWACAAAAAGLLIFVAPIRNLNWEAGDGSTYGFGYRDRSEIEATAAFVRARTGPQALVAAPPIIAFAADRRELVPYPEIAGTIDALTEAVRRRGYIAALRDPDLRGGAFWDTVDASRERIAPQIASAVKDRRVAAVVNDSPDDLMPVLFVALPQNTLEAAGYQLESASAHYDVWLRH